jgi:hypothetical protein
MWDPRWYNPGTYCSKVTNFQASQFFKCPNDGVTSFLPISKDQEDSIYVSSHKAADHLNCLTDNNYACYPDGNDVADLDGDFSNVAGYSGDESAAQRKFSFTKVSSEAASIVSFVQNNQAELRKVFAFFNQVKNAYHSGKLVDMSFTTRINPRAEVGAPHAVTRALPNSNRVKRKKSHIENYRKSSKRNKKSAYSQKSKNNEMTKAEVDTEMVLHLSKKGGGCQICGQMGHQRFSCDILTKFGTVVYGEKSRERIVKDLYNAKGILRNKTLLELDDIVFESLPTNAVMGLILHRRYRYDGNVVMRAIPVIAGGIHPDYREKLFAIGPIISWVMQFHARPLVNAIPQVDDIGDVSIPVIPISVPSAVGVSQHQNRIQNHEGLPPNCTFGQMDGLQEAGPGYHFSQRVGTSLTTNPYMSNKQRVAVLNASRNAFIRDRAAALTVGVNASAAFLQPGLRPIQVPQNNILQMSQLSQQSNGSAYGNHFGSLALGNLAGQSYDFTEVDDGFL